MKNFFFFLGGGGLFGLHSKIFVGLFGLHWKVKLAHLWQEILATLPSIWVVVWIPGRIQTTTPASLGALILNQKYADFPISDAQYDCVAL